MEEYDEMTPEELQEMREFEQSLKAELKAQGIDPDEPQELGDEALESVAGGGVVTRASAIYMQALFEHYLIINNYGDGIWKNPELFLRTNASCRKYNTPEGRGEVYEIWRKAKRNIEAKFGYDYFPG